MYQDFYGFEKLPFGNTPNSKTMFLTKQHREALNHMLYSLVNRKGFMLLTGEIGAGKSTVCRAALDRLDDSFETAWIVNPSIQEASLFKAIALEFGLEINQHEDSLEVMHKLNRFLVNKYLENKIPILIIDEAQNLSLESLEQIRLLSNLETAQEKLLQIVLVGQPELRDKINHSSLVQLKQRIQIKYHLTNLNKEELEAYIDYLVQLADPSLSPTFTSPALAKIHRFTKGIPRLINSVCDKSLLAGYVYRDPEINRDMVSRAIKEISGTI